MKTLEEIKEEYAKHYKYKDWIDFLANTDDLSHDKALDDIAKEYAIEVAKEAQMNCAENAKLTGEWSFEHHDYINSVDKQSILSETNIPKLD